ncbi:MAG: hypothetical protein OXD31_17595 [Chloroflexi bacterium]|nr:hypothetical protein [Chloroflexota bacterium]
MDEERQRYREELASARGEIAEAISNLPKLNQRVGQIEEELTCDPDCSQPKKDVESINACELNVAAPVATVALGNPPEKVVSPLGEWDGQRAATESTLSGLDSEFLLGRNWFAFVGGIAAVLRIGFFLKLAFDNDWSGTLAALYGHLAAP